MKRSKILSAFLCGTMMVTMVPQVLMADEEGDTSEVSEDTRIEITEATFPDEVFRNYISRNADTDHDGFLSYDEIDVFEVVELTGIAQDIHDLTGIRYLKRLVRFRADGAQISTVDLSGLDYLEYFMIEDSPLSSITLDNERLEAIYLSGTGLSSIDVTNCPALKCLDILDTEIFFLDVSGNRAYSDRLSNAVLWFEGDTFGESQNNAAFYVTNVREDTDTTSSAEGVLMANDGIIFRFAPSEGQEELPDYDPSTLTETGIAGFVERMYTVALNRASDPAGKADWIASVTERGGSGADVARGFLLSPEFLNKGYSDVDFVTVLYRTFFNRNPDDAGLVAWVNALSNGASKQDIIEGFINSTEFANLCLTYGIACGGTGVPNIEVEPNSATIEFATRLYTTCLGRDADEPGMLAWARQLANQRDTGTGAARGFFFSEEFTRQSVSNEEYVNRLYRTFMGREADEAGFSAWVSQLNDGVSREEVFNGFAESPEFARICASYGIIKGS